MKRILLCFTIILVGSSFFSSRNQLSVVSCQSAVSVSENLLATDTSLRIIHTYVSLCDNDSQGIVPVPRKIGNGNDAANNLYWGCKYGVKTFFTQSDDWQLLDSSKNISKDILQRCVWKNRRYNTYLVADAYRGARIKNCTVNFLLNVSGHPSDTAFFHQNGESKMLAMEDANLVCYVGHDGFMDFEIPNPPPQNSAKRKEVIILACASRLYFKDAVLTAGGIPVLWTTNLLSPEAYTLKAAIDGWMLRESGDQIRDRAAKAYDSYQKCGYNAALDLFATGYY